MLGQTGNGHHVIGTPGANGCEPFGTQWTGRIQFDDTAPLSVIHGHIVSPLCASSVRRRS